MEVWRVITEFPNYEVSDHGRVRHRNGRVKAQCLDNYGYPHITARAAGGVCLTRRIHRLVAQAFIPNPDALPQVDHIDHSRSNNHVSNLRWCTVAENNQNRCLYKSNRTGYAGVYHCAKRQRYCARVQVARRNVFLGWFREIEEAARVVAAARQHYFGTFAPHHE